MKNNRVVNTVHKTSEYDMFKDIFGNRKITKSHITNIKQSFSEKQIEAPIIVNEKYEVIEGQHRFRSCKQLNLPIYYIMLEGLELEDVQRLNANSKNWNLSDHCHSFCVRGFKEYIIYRDFKAEFGFNENETIAMLEGVSDKNKTRPLWAKFKSGKFRVANLKRSTENASRIIEVKQYYDGYRKRCFVFAMLTCFEADSWDHSVFMEKLSKQSGRLTDQVHEDDYMRVIQKIYNYRNKKPIKLFY